MQFQLGFVMFLHVGDTEPLSAPVNSRISQATVSNVGLISLLPTNLGVKPCMRLILFRMILVVTLCTLAFGLVACAKSEPPQSSASNQGGIATQPSAGSPSPLPRSGEQATTTSGTATGKGKIDACALLTGPEIRSVQGESLKETKASSSVENGFSISQCFFTLPTFTNSISLVVTQKGDGAGARDPKEFWKATFDKESEGERGNERDKRSEKERKEEAKKARDRNREEEEKEAALRQKIAGAGDEAFWTGSLVGGALYVLKGNTYLRVSVGGAGDQQTKINKSKALARLALKRL
jgi:hypothetical protein